MKPIQHNNYEKVDTLRKICARSRDISRRPLSGTGNMHFKPGSINNNKNSVQKSAMQNQVDIKNKTEELSAERKYLLIRKMLTLLLHANLCKKGQSSSSSSSQNHEQLRNVRLIPEKTCPVPYCEILRGVLHHISTCKEGKICNYPHCSSAQQILQHWTNCKVTTCPICAPLRTTIQSASTAPPASSNRSSVPLSPLQG